MKLARPLLPSLFLLLSPLTVVAQREVSELDRAHASALQAYIAKRPKVEFMSERVMDKDTLGDMRKNLGASLTPYYRRGDFNRDGIQDFAAILSREGPRVEQEGVTSEPHLYRYPVVVVIFNGQRKGGYRVAFEKETDAPLVCLLSMTREKRPRLAFGVYETDEGFIMTPAGRGYLVEYPDY